MNQMIYVDPALMKGKPLRTAIFAKEVDNSWIIQSDNPEIQNIDKYELLPREKVLQQYPELEKLFQLELDDTIYFKKGLNSGKWYDFVKSI